MNTANLNRAVTGFGMALAAMGASQADAEIVSLSFSNSPLSLPCNDSCNFLSLMFATWSGVNTAAFNIYIYRDTTYNSQSVLGDTNVARLAFKNINDTVSRDTMALNAVGIANVTGDRYLGFNTTDNLNGWIKVNFAGSAEGTRTVTFLEGEIETTAGTAITAGGGLTPVPVPPMLPAMGLAVLALGAAGVRRSRKAA